MATLSAATRPALLRRARVLAQIRRFFAERNVLEVETPMLSAAAVTDPALDSIACRVTALGGTQYLRTSPEFAHKRLLAAGSGDIFELGRVFRDGELGRWHEPEFTLLEWYRIGFSAEALMDEVLDLLRLVLARRLPALQARRLAYGEAFAASFGIDAHHFDAREQARLCESLRRQGIDVPAGLEGNALLDLALTQVIVPRWPRGQVTFLYGYPASQAALAAIEPGNPPTAARFEVFVDGVELGNGYRELTDPEEQERRFEADLAVRRATGKLETPVDHTLLEALRAGLPECAGVAIGFDRLLAVRSGTDSIAGVMSLSHGEPSAPSGAAS